MKNKIIKNIPNMITISRISASFLACIMFILGNFPVSLGFYVYAACSDAVDGYFARKLNATSELGRKLDAISDKLFVASLIFPSIIMGNYLMLIPLFLETKIAYINLKTTRLTSRAITEKVGKLKTIVLFPTIILGFIATKVPSMYFVLFPFLITSINLQNKTIESSKKQLEQRLNFKYEEKDNNVINPKVGIINNLNSLKNDLYNYSLSDNTLVSRQKSRIKIKK